MRVLPAWPRSGSSRPKSPSRRRAVGPPTTALGRRSLALVGAAIAFWAVFTVAIVAGVRGDSALILEVSFLAAPALGGALAMLGAGGVAVAAAIRGERSILLVVPLLLGLLTLVFVIGELVSPH